VTAGPEGCDQGLSPRPHGAGRGDRGVEGDTTHWLTDPEYAALRYRLEAAHAAVEAALVEARRRVRLNEEQG
jgi:hypothetical protein